MYFNDDLVINYYITSIIYYNICDIFMCEHNIKIIVML